MSQLNDVLDQSVRAQDAPFLVAMVGDKDGVRWSGSSGDRATGQKATQDTVFRIFSMTKSPSCVCGASGRNSRRPAMRARPAPRLPMDPKEVLEYIARTLVDDPDAGEVTSRVLFFRSGDPK